jgi:hypothetical protein
MLEPAASTFKLSLSQKFQLERSNRAIDDCQDMEKLKKIAKMMAQAYFGQLAANAWAIKEGNRSRVRGENG